MTSLTISLRFHWLLSSPLLLFLLIICSIDDNTHHLLVVAHADKHIECTENCTALHTGPWPACPLYTTNGIVDPYQTIVRCTISHIPAGMNPISYFTGEATSVSTGLGINNLMEINEVEGTCTMDIFFELYWKEPRLNLTNLFNVMIKSNPHIEKDGIDITTYYQDNPPLQSDPQIFMPDINFIDARSIDIIAYKTTIFPNGYIFSSQHMVLETVQPLFDYHDYPIDNQIIQIRYENYAVPDDIVKLVLLNQSITFVTNENYDHQSVINFAQNKIWSYQSSYAYKTVAYYNDLPFDRLIFDIEIQRKSQGLIMRLSVPIMLLLILVSLTYWADAESRVDSTITILLAVSALYIVIFDNIPMLGYLTRIDKYILHMFLMLILAVFSHQAVIVCDKHGEEKCRPLSTFFSRLIEATGKFLIFPYVLVTFETYFLVGNPDANMVQLKNLLWTLISIYFVFIYPSEAYYLYYHWNKAIESIKEKIDKRDTEYAGRPARPDELFFFNLWMYGKIDFDQEYHIEKMEKDKEFTERCHSIDENENHDKQNPLHTVKNIIPVVNEFKQAAVRRNTRNNGIEGKAEGVYSTKAASEKELVDVEMANQGGMNSSHTQAYKGGAKMASQGGMNSPHTQVYEGGAKTNTHSYLNPQPFEKYNQHSFEGKRQVDGDKNDSDDET